MRSGGSVVVGHGVRATWARSTVYGSSIALGPTQEAVYRYAWGMTANGRRPEVTLARIAADLGKPVSSVHNALGRLRALGLLGVSARTGRAGGHRLWRVARGTASSVRLDVARHKRAIARIMRRWYGARPARTLTTAERPVPAPIGPAALPPLRSGPTFREAMRRAGFRRWWKEGTDDEAEAGSSPDDRGRAPDGDNRGADTLGLVVDTSSPERSSVNHGNAGLAGRGRDLGGSTADDRVGAQSR